MSGIDRDYLDTLAARAKQTFGDGPVPDVRNRTRAIVGVALGDGAARALEAIRHGIEPLPRDLAALEWSIRLLRPATLVTPTSELSPLPAVHPEVTREFPTWDAFRANVAPFLSSIGRVERIWDDQRSLVGTGFLVAANMILTNRHVLDDLSFASRILSDDMASIHFRYEFGAAPAEQPVKIIAVRAYHRKHDLALLEIEPQPNRTIIPMSDRVADKDERVVAIGFPGEKSSRNPRFVDALFGAALGVKRASPGRVIGGDEGNISHDCSTLGGSSGSPIFSQDRGDLVGVHYSGEFAWRNDAVTGPIAAAFVRQYV